MAQDREAVLYFDGDEDYVRIADGEALQVNNYTVEVWIKTDGVPTVSLGIIGKPGRNYHIWLSPTGFIAHRFHTTAGTDQGHQTDPNVIQWNKWQHIAITNDGTTAKIYINGELKKESPTGSPLVVDKTDLIMGASPDGNRSYWFKGQMTEVRLWNKVRSAAEIKANMYRRLEGKEQGLAGYWPLNDIANNTASDKTENGNHGKIYGAVEDAELPLIDAKREGTDARQYVLKCDGNGNHVKVDNPPSPRDALTVSCWAKSSVNVTKFSRLIRHPKYILEQHPNNKTFSFYIYSGTWYVISATLTDIDMTKWHHYTGTFDGQIMRSYVDGVEVKNAGLSRKIDENTSPMYIGTNEDGYFLNGKITEVRVWDKALSPAELKQNMSHRLTGNEAGLVGYWPLDKGSGDIVTDQTANKKHGQIINAVWDEQFPIGVVPSPKVEIVNIFYDGDNKIQKANQYVEISNRGKVSMDLSDWQLKSLEKPQNFFFPKGTTLGVGQTIRVYTNEVHSESGGFTFKSEWGIWKKSGDKATLLDAKGKEVSSLSFGDKA